MVKVQHIRKSQFITTFGPGSIIETTEGPRVILRPDIGLFNEHNRETLGISPKKLEISHDRMSQGYLRGARVFELPSNAELEVPQNYVIYRTRPFPEWSLCPKHGILYHQSYGCPKCREELNRELKNKGYSDEEREREIKWRLREQGRKQAIRFILACPKGHMGDISWPYEVHKNSSKPCNHNNSWFEWIRKGPSLSDVVIRCPECKASVTLKEIYQRPHSCPSTYLERNEKPGETKKCEEKAYVIQRQASNLYVPEIVTLFTVPPRATTLHKILERDHIKGALRVLVDPDGTALEDREGFLKRLERVLTTAELTELESYDWDDVRQIILDIINDSREIPTTPYELFKEEFESFIMASEKGFPPVKSNIKKDKVLFYVNRNNVRTVYDENGVGFRVTPIEKLHTVMVLKGYRRFVGKPGDSDDSLLEADLVSVGFKEGDTEWYPGVQLFGEGVFITFRDPQQLWEYARRKSKEHYDRWFSAFTAKGRGYPDHLFKDPSTKFELHPAFVFWHTLSHMLIRAISVDSGYSAASIRERVYVKIDDPNHPEGGVILYTAQPNADGTLGGLISLVRKFEKILNRACDFLYSCSNDPLCIEQEFRFTLDAPTMVNGAACYACTLISETSCEHRNMWLDRHVPVEWMEGLE